MHSVFVILLFLAAFGLTAAGVCDSAPDVDGCSIPLDLPYFYKDVFESDCNKHDICYSCGSRYGIDRLTCDTRFKQNIRATCLTNPDVSNEIWCLMVTFDYYAAVREFGKSHYKDPSPGWCSQSYVSRCIA